MRKTDIPPDVTDRWFLAASGKRASHITPSLDGHSRHLRRATHGAEKREAGRNSGWSINRFLGTAALMSTKKIPKIQGKRQLARNHVPRRFASYRFNLR
jgi:hypothetical protein